MRILSNQDLIRKAEIAEHFGDWIEALFYYYELINNTNNQALIRACIEDIQAIQLIVKAIEAGDKIRAKQTNKEE